MATATINYSSNQTITIGLTSLTSSSTFLAGRESNEVDNTTTKFVDALVRGSVTVGTPTAANLVIAVYVWGSNTSLTTAPIDTLDGADSNETIAAGNLTALRLGASILVPATTANVKYEVLPFSIAALFGGAMPKFWGLFVSHNTGGALNASGNANAFEYVGIKYDIA
jgi:hypothetical protein